MNIDPNETIVTRFENVEDEEIVEYVQVGDNEALEHLIFKYKNFVRAKAKSYFLIGADREDIVQEGMIGLYKAIRDFKGTSSHHLKPLLNCVSQTNDHSGEDGY